MARHVVDSHVAEDGVLPEDTENIVFEFDDENILPNRSGDVDQIRYESCDGLPVDPNLNAVLQNATNAAFSPDNEEHVDVRTRSGSRIVTVLRKISQWQNLLAVVLVTGTICFSVRDFEVYRNGMNRLLRTGFPEEHQIPAYSTVVRTLLPMVRFWGFPNSGIITAEVDAKKAGTCRSRQGSENMGKFIVVQPSAWSEVDVSCPQTCRMLKSASEEPEMDSRSIWFENIGSTPMLRCRNHVLNNLSSIMVPIADGSERLNTPITPDVMWNISLKTHHPIPADLMVVLGQSVNDNRRFLSVTLRPIRTVLVSPFSTISVEDTAFASELAFGNLAQLRTEIRGLWYNGDYCTALRANADVNYLLVLVHHQVRAADVSMTMELLLIPYESRRRSNNVYCTLQWRRTVKVSVSYVSVSGQCLSFPRQLFRTPEANRRIVPSYGRLQNGMRYFIDRILLYSDGFNQYRSKQGSVGGVYCLSLNYLPSLRRTRERVRPLALTPPGVSTNEGLRSVLSDLVTTATSGIKVRNADDEYMMLFTDIVGFVCDYCEAGHVLDVVGHNGKAPCHLCSFLRFKGHNSTSSQYCSSTTIHGGNACFARSGPRTEAIRGSDISGQALVTTGLKCEADAASQRSSIVELYLMLTKALTTVRIPLTEGNLPVLNPRFDPYRSLLVAPDHLLTGIAKNELTLVFKALPKRTRRIQAETMICELLLRNGLLEESSIFNSSTSTLHTTSISATFCILLMAAPVFSEVIANISCPEEMSEVELAFIRRIIRNLCLFRKLVVRTYWYPRRNVDDPQSVKDFNREEGMYRISALQDACAAYISECNEICKLSQFASTELDKPNMHRLLELYNHSIPAIGHVHHFAELLFECAHQPMKKAMSGSNFQETHLQGMKHAVADDWKGRLAAAFGLSENGRDEDVSCLLNVLCGRHDEVINFVSGNSSLTSEVKNLLQNNLMTSVTGTVPTHLDYRETGVRWRLTDLSNKKNNTPETKARRSHVESLIKQYLISIDPKEATSFEKGKRMKVWGSGPTKTWSHSRSHDTVSRGNAVQVLLMANSYGVLQPPGPGDTEHGDIYSISYFAIEDLFENSIGEIHAAVRRCLVTDKGFMMVDERTTSEVLILTDSVRRIGIILACHLDPKLRCIRAHDENVDCTASIIKDNLYHFFNRESGYPPRMA